MFPRRRRTSSEPAFRVVFRSASPSAPLRAAALRTLQQELAELQSGPSTDGFRVACDENNLFKWTVAIFGPPDTLFQGGYFKATLTFPPNYPQSPPTMRFVPPLWHPNVYKSGELCISILHAPGDDQLSGELATERWSPQQNVRTVLLSVISLLNDPNTESPANVDAAISYRNYKENTDQKYARIVRRQVEKSKADAQRDGVVVPETVDEYQGQEKREGERVALIRLRDIFDASDSLDDLIAEDEATTAQNSSSHSTLNSSSSNSSAENVLNNQQQNNNNADNAIVNVHNLANANNNNDGPDPEQQERIRALQDELAALINNLFENAEIGDGGAAAEEPRGEDNNNNANAMLLAGNDPALREEGTNDGPGTARVHSEPLLITQGDADPIDMRTAHGGSASEVNPDVAGPSTAAVDRGDGTEC